MTFMPLSFIPYFRSPKAETTPKKKVKESRVWDLGPRSNKDAAELDVFDTAKNKDQVNVTADEVIIITPLFHEHFWCVWSYMY